MGALCVQPAAPDQVILSNIAPKGAGAHVDFQSKLTSFGAVRSRVYAPATFAKRMPRCTSNNSAFKLPISAEYPWFLGRWRWLLQSLGIICH